MPMRPRYRKALLIASSIVAVLIAGGFAIVDATPAGYRPEPLKSTELYTVAPR